MVDVKVSQFTVDIFYFQWSVPGVKRCSLWRSTNRNTSEKTMFSECGDGTIVDKGF